MLKNLKKVLLLSEVLFFLTLQTFIIKWEKTN